MHLGNAELALGRCAEAVRRSGDHATCYRALDAVGDPRAARWLERADAQVQATVDRIADPTFRRAFLTNIPFHLDIMELADRARAAGAAARP